MRYRQLGSSDLQVSEISLGSWMTYGGGVEQEQAEACIATAFDVGINFIDTANVYSRGQAEEFLGEVLTGPTTRLVHPRDEALLPDVRHRPRAVAGAGLQADRRARSHGCARSYVDLYQCHRYDWDTPLEETMEALTEVVRQGKVRYLGFSEWPVEKMQEALAAAGRREVRLEPAAVLDDLARARARPHRRSARSTASRRSCGRRSPRACSPASTSPGAAAARRTAARRRSDELLHGRARRRHAARARAATPAHRGRARHLTGATRARVGAARAERRVRDHRRLEAASRSRDNAAASGIELDEPRSCGGSTRSLGDSVRIRGGPRRSDADDGTRHRSRSLGRRRQRAPDGARASSSGCARRDALAADRLDLRDVVRRDRAGSMAALDRLDDLEEFMLQPAAGGDLPAALAVAAAARSARTTTGCPQTIEERLGDLDRDRARPRRVAGRGRRVRDRRQRGRARQRRRARTSSPTRRARRRPRRWRRRCSPRPPSARSCCRGRSDDRIATDGAWVRNFPLGHAYHQPGVELIVSFRYLPTLSAAQHRRGSAAPTPARAVPEGPAGQGARSPSCARRRSAASAASPRTGAT